MAGIIILIPGLILLIGAAYENLSLPFLIYNPQKDGKKLDRVFGGGSEILFGKDFVADYTCTVGMILTFAGLFMIAFSRMLYEDEYVSFMRLKALQISVYVNYIILALSSLVMFGFSFLVIMQVNLFTILVLFILIFNYSLYIKPRLSKKEAI